MILSMDKLNKFYGADHVLKNISLTIEDGDRIGLIGVNGAGKTTLLNIIDGTLDYEDGSKDINRHATIGFLKQNSGLNSSNTIHQEIQDVFKDVNDAMERILKIEDKISRINDHNSEEYSKLLEDHNRCENIISAGDGYNIGVKINTILNGMNLGNKSRDSLISTLSGGEKTRLAICKLLLEEPKLLILDEPTNHLDFKALLWLEDYLKNYKGALLIVSHDRYFLDSLVGQVWELERGKLTSYKGNYTKYLTLKEEAETLQLKLYKEQQQEIKKLEEYVAKNLVRASTSDMAKSRQKTLDRMERIERPQGDIKPAKLRFEYTREPVKDVLDLKGVSLSVGDENSSKDLLKNFDLHVFRGEKIAIIGENGVGKSSLLKAIQGIIPYDSGEITWGKHCLYSYFEQESNNLNMDKTALDELWDRFPATFEHRIRSILGSVLIVGEECYKLVGELSGGERAKLKFAIMSMEQGNVLIMDEPTNHLDLKTKEVLDTALSEFTGTIIMISHDRYLLSKVPTKILELKKDGYITYNGSYNEYLKAQENKTLNQPKEKKETALDTSSKVVYTKSKEMRSVIASLRNQKTKQEQQIKEIETLLEELELNITTPEYTDNYQLLNEACLEIENQKNNLDDIYLQWMDTCEQLSNYDKD